jgi:HlyD family secretion protein
VPLEAIVERAPPTANAQGGAPGNGVPAATPAAGGERPKAQKGVFLLEDNKVRFIEVTTGITGEAEIEVTSGVNKEMEIVRGPSRVLKTLKDGMTVKRQTRKPGNSNANEG